MPSRPHKPALREGTGRGGGVVNVPAAQGGSVPTPAERANLSQAERAALALAEGRPGQEISLEQAFLVAALDFRQTLRVLVAAVVPRFADWCFVDLLDGDGIPRRVEVAHADPAKASLAQEMRSISFGPGWATPAAQAIRDHAPRLFRELSNQRELSNELMLWATHDERHLGVLRAIHPNSLLAVPLIARDRAIGALTLIRSTTLPPFAEGDLAFAEAVGVPAALALDNARWFQAEKAARNAAEEQADRERHGRIEAEREALHLRRLESVASSLSSILPPHGIARVAVENGLSALQPSSATVVSVTPGGDYLELLHQEGWPDDLVLEQRRMRSDAPALVAEAWRIQTAIWLSRPEALAQTYPNAVEHARRVGDQAWAAVPLRVDGRTVGALELGFPHPRELDAGERRFLLAVAQQIAQALERARLRGQVS